MLSKTTQSQIDKITTAKLDDYDESTHTYHIKKYIEDSYEVGKCYLVELDSALTTSYGNPSLISNWNKGTYPSEQYMRIAVVKKLNKMIYVDSLGYDVNNQLDLDYTWSGWLPTDNLHILKYL